MSKTFSVVDIRLQRNMIRLYVAVVLLITLKTVYSSSFTEYAPVVEEDLIQEGYACKSTRKYIDIMKEGEERLNYAPGVCGKVKCKDGIITYTMCGEQIADEGCYYVFSDPNQAYPGCCYNMRCP